MFLFCSIFPMDFIYLIASKSGKYMEGGILNKKYKISARFSLSAICLILCLGIFYYLYYNYTDYQVKLTHSLEISATSDLTESTKIAKKTLQKNIKYIYNELHDLIMMYKVINKSDYSSEEIDTYIKQYNNTNSLGSLHYLSKDEIISQVIKKDSSHAYKIFLHNLLKKKEQLYVPDSAEDIIELGVPICYDGDVIGAVFSTYNNLTIDELFNESTFQGYGQATLIKLQNDIIRPITSNKKHQFNYLEEFKFCKGFSLQKVKNDFQARNFAITHYSYKGQCYYAYYMPLETQNLYMVNIISAPYLEREALFYKDLANKLIAKIIIGSSLLFILILVLQIVNYRFQKSALVKQKLEQQRFNTIMKHTKCDIWEYNISDDILTKSNDSFGIFVGKGPVKNASLFFLNTDTIDPQSSDDLISFYGQIVNGEQELKTTIKAKNAAGGYSWFEITATTIFNHQGKPISVIGQTHNIDEKKKELDLLYNNSTKDSLTMLLNHKTAIQYINKILAKSSEADIHAFYMIDIDNFSYINETYGHSYGDTVLLEFSLRLQDIFGDEHILARIGGDEFIVFLKTASNLEEVKHYANSIRETFINILSDENVHHNVTGSIGISIYPQDGTKFGELFTKADMALYYSKRLGKNCFSMFSKSLMTSMDYLPSMVSDSVENNLQTSGSTVIESTLLANIVDVLFDAKRLDASINAILKLIGNTLSLDNIEIYEVASHSNNTVLTYEWASVPENRVSESFTSIPMEYARDFTYYKDSTTNIFYHNKAFCLPYGNSKYGDEFRKIHTYSIFQCGLIDQGNDKGYIEACRNDPEKPWTKLEIDTLSVIFKIIGGYLLKLQTEKSAEEAAKTDSLTHSSNMFSFIQIANKLIAEHSDNHYAIVYSDIKNFKYINETHGFAEGNRILVSFAQALRNSLDEEETYGRVNADRFVALMKFTSDRELNQRICDISNFLNNVARASETSYKISILTGVYPLSSEDKDINKCMDLADTARKTITDSYKSSIAYFDNDIKTKITRKKQLEDLLDDALSNHEFVVYYQPKFLLDTNQICGAEALVRWKRPDGTLVPPFEFIPIFEDNGLIIDLDFYVCNLVCQKVRNLLDEGKQPIPISINFSRLHLRDKNLLPRLISIVNSYNIPSKYIEVEITESALSQKSDNILEILNSIHDSGFKLAMDDFGTGLSSLNLLRDLPFDVIKLDKDFFQKGASTSKERTIIEYIVKMCLALGLEIVSEGVETEDQAEFLRTIHCPIAQGYLYEKPIPEDIFFNKYFD